VTDSSIPPDDDLDLFLGDIENTTDFGDVQFAEAVTEPPPPFVEEPLEEASPFEDATIPVGDGACVVCGAPTFRPPGLTKAGHRKRTPKYCDLHNPKLRIPEAGPFPHGMESQLQRVQEELADDLRLLGVMAGPMLPVTGYYLFENADAFTTALLKLCKNNQRALRVLHRAASVAPVYEVAKDAAGVFYAVQVDLKKLEPNTTVSERLGVKRAYDAVYPSDVTGQENNVINNGYQGPPKYAPAR
jgi:hypothetical protein